MRLRVPAVPVYGIPSLRACVRSHSPVVGWLYGNAILCFFHGGAIVLYALCGVGEWEGGGPLSLSFATSPSRSLVFPFSGVRAENNVAL